MKRGSYEILRPSCCEVCAKVACHCMAVKKKLNRQNALFFVGQETDLLKKGATPDAKITSKWFLMASSKS